MKRAFRIVIGHRILRRASAIVAASESERAGFARTLGKHSPPVLLAGLGVDVPSSPQAHRFESRHVMFLSRVAPKKRLDKLLDAGGILASSGRPITITVCGDGDPELIARLKADTPAGVEVRWHGHVVDPERSAIEADQALVCLPSDNENFGQVVTESMARGLPVLTTRSTGSSSHLVAADAGWVLDDPTPAELADGLDLALQDPDVLREKSARGVAYAGENLTWDTVAERWLDRVHDLAAARGR